MLTPKSASWKHNSNIHCVSAENSQYDFVFVFFFIDEGFW